MFLLYFQWGHPAATEDRPKRHYDEHPGPARAPQKTKSPWPLSTITGLANDAGKTHHNRRRLFGSTGFTG